jgi:outer membrane protein assembly factor BamB
MERISSLKILRNNKTRTVAVIFATVLMLAATFFAILPLASAKITTIANAAVTPDPVGKGQTLYIVGWVNPPPTTYDGVYVDYTFVITRPDGTTDTKYFAGSNTDATKSFLYVCNTVGQWSVVLKWPGDQNHTAVESLPYKWTVQEQAVANTNPDVPLPTGPWSWPIHTSNHEWYQISGDWPNAWHDGAGTNFNAYSKAPNTAHVLWKYPLQSGGLIGGDEGANNWIESPTIPVVGMGKMFFSYSSGFGTTQHPVVICLDLLTGKQIWAKDLPITNGTTTLASGGGGMALHTTGYVKGYEEVNPQPGVPATKISIPAQNSLWMVGNGVWQINPFNGNVIYYNPITVSASQGKGGGILMDNDGNIYFTNYPSGNISRFNTYTKALVWTIKIPTGDAGIGQPWVYKDLLLGNNRPTGGDPYGISLTAINTTNGKIVVNGTIMANGLYPTGGFQGGIGNDMVVEHCMDRYWYATSVTTGQLMWKSDVQSSYPWGAFNMYNSATAYGIYYQGQYDGYLYALNYTNGKLIWKFYTDNNTDISSGSNIPWSQFAVADGKIYFATGEHDTPNPMPRGNTLYCVDAFTGKLIWKFYGFQDRGTGGGAHAHGISSGVMWYYNTYDGQLYTFGKGETATTIAASPKVIGSGTSVVIEGTVMDQSPASPNTPALSDADMSAYMEYLHTQNQRFPTNAKGVTVHLQAVRSDGTMVDITHVTSDTLGHYEYLWTPTDKGTYKIIATFEGSESYYASSAECALGVVAASVTPIVTPTPTANPTASPIVTPTIAPTPTPTTPQGPGGVPASTMYAISAAVVIIVIVAVAAVALRRRK